jgi:signal transduction histidine kinase
MFKNKIINAHITNTVEMTRLNGYGKKNNLSLFTNAMQNCSNLLCIATDPFGVITLFNAGAELSLGFTSVEVLNKLSLADLCNPDDLMKRNDEMNAEFETSINIGFETVVFIAAEGIEDLCALTYISKTGRRFRVEVSVNASYDDSGKLIGYMVIGTEKRYSQEDENPQKATKADAIYAQNQSKNVFLSHMSHEIRNPLNAIIGFAEILHENLKDVKHIAQVDAISKSGKILLHLVNEILDLSKIEAGKMKLELEPVNLNDLFSEIKMMFNQKARDKDLVFNVCQDSDLFGKLMLDEHHLRQILVNLVENALKFTEKGSINLTLQKVVKSNKFTDLTISVWDTGIGIAEDQQELIFEPFHQQEGQCRKKFAGTGLGLSISNRLVEMMDGEISVTSELEKGSIFQVVLHNVAIKHEKKKENRIPVMDIFRFEDARKLTADTALISKAAYSDISEPTNSQKTNWVHVINVLENDFLPLNRSVIERQLIEQIDYFGKGLILFGETNFFKILTDYGTEICQYVDNFEVDKMMKTLKLFPGIINKIKSMDHQLVIS